MEPHQALDSKLSFPLKIGSFIHQLLSTYILEFDFFHNNLFYDCSLVVTSTYVKRLYNVSKRLRLNKPM